jgi:hypothetical protein
MTIISSSPAYLIVAGHNNFETREEFAIAYESKNHGTLYNFYTLGCVADFAAEMDADPVAAEQKAIANGHQVFWANLKSTMITSDKRQQQIVRGIKHGDVINYKGKSFTVQPTRNNNVKLVQI